MKVIEITQEEIDAFETLEVLGDVKYEKWMGDIHKYLDKFVVYIERKIIGENKYFIYEKIDNDNIREFIKTIQNNKNMNNFITNILIDREDIRCRIKDKCNKYKVEYIDRREK